MSTEKTDGMSGKTAPRPLSKEEFLAEEAGAAERPLPAGCFLHIMTDFAAKQTTRPLYEQSFGDPEDFTDYYYSDKCRDNTIVAITDASGAVLSMAHLNPYTLSVCGHETRSYYIVAVATDVRFRHRGLMTAVLHAAFRIAASEHIPFIWLLPVDPAIYTPSGFEVICDFHAADHESSCLSHGLPEAALNKMNGALKENYDIFCVRDKTYLRRERIEATLDSGEEDSGLPENPKIMAKVTDGAVLRSMLPGKLREESPYDALRSLRCLFTEEV